MVDDTSTVPAAIPWYKSRVLIALTTIVVTQVMTKVQAHYHIDFAVFGLTANDIAEYILDAISAGAAGVLVHARVTKPSPPVTLTKAAANAANTTPPKDSP